MQRYLIPILFWLIVIMSSTAYADISGLYNTGVNDLGQLLQLGQQDSHYKLTMYANQAVSPTPATVLYDPSWIANDNSSQWILPTNSYRYPDGIYVYTTTFNVTNANNVQLSGLWTADDYAKIYLNGVYTGVYIPGVSATFQQLFPFTVNSGLVNGKNTLEFQVFNGEGYDGSAPLPVDNDTGLRVAFNNTTETPIPSAFLLFGSGLVGLIGFRRNAKSLNE